MEPGYPFDSESPLHLSDVSTRVPVGLLENQGSASGRSGDDDGLLPDASRPLLKRTLLSTDIFMIVISGTIGMGLFENSGEALSIAGPGGGIIAFGIVGIGVICVMEGIATMICQWPIENAMVEFVNAFVDRDLATVVGIAYWYISTNLSRVPIVLKTFRYSYALNFATMILAAVKLASYWDLAFVLQSIPFIVGAPILLLSINFLGILWYGRIEVGLGILKITFVVGTFLAMLIINEKDTNANTPNGKIQSTYISEGFQNNPIVASTRLTAVLVAIPIITYAYIGVEIVAATALEAKSSRSLKFTAKNIAWITTIFYIVVAIGFYLNVSWTDPLLVKLSNIIMRNSPAIVPPTSITRTDIIAVVSLLNTHMPKLAGLVNGCLIMAVLSAANTNLYVASRTLFGLAREILARDIEPYIGLLRWLSKLGMVGNNSKIPAVAVGFSALAFAWLPFLRFTESYNDERIRQIVTGITTSSVLLVWGSQCLAFIRYHQWVGKFRGTSLLTGDYLQYHPLSSRTDRIPVSTYLHWLQPYPAYIGLAFCISTALIFFTASIWNGNGGLIISYSALLSPIVWIILLLLFKLIRFGSLFLKFKWYVELGSWEQLRMRLDFLSIASAEHQRSIPLNILEPLPPSSWDREYPNIQLDSGGQGARSTGYDDPTESRSPTGASEDQSRTLVGDIRRRSIPTSGISSSVLMPNQSAEASKFFPRTFVADKLSSSIVSEVGPSSGALGQQVIQSLETPINILQATVPPTTNIALTTEQATVAAVVGAIASTGVVVNIGTNIATVRQNERKLAIEEQQERDRVADRKKKEEEEERNKQKDNELRRNSGDADGDKRNATAMNETTTSEEATQTSPSKSNTINSQQTKSRSPYVISNHSGHPHTRATAAKLKEDQQAQLRATDNVNKLLTQVEDGNRKRKEEKLKNIEKFKREHNKSQFPVDESTLHNARLISLRKKDSGLAPPKPKGSKFTAEASDGSPVKGKGKASASPMEDVETATSSNDEDMLAGGQSIGLGRLLPVDQNYSNLTDGLNTSHLLYKDEESTWSNPGILDDIEDQNPKPKIKTGISKDNIDSQEQSINGEGSGEVAQQDKPTSSSKNSDDSYGDV
ncbi:hypothetical protein N431DRAFT_180098 [Stipitochalara longipes BDJ]|nr:hypothetical protein N431DRAFT_180098 [Stipitochalara longipes BDJ]